MTGRLLTEHEMFSNPLHPPRKVTYHDAPEHWNVEKAERWADDWNKRVEAMTTPTPPAQDGDRERLIAEASNFHFLRKQFVSMMARIEQRFRSGSSVPVESAHLTAEEWALMDHYETECEALCTDQAMEIESKSAELAVLRAQVEGLRGALEYIAEGNVEHFNFEEYRSTVEDFRETARNALAPPQPVAKEAKP